MNGVQHMIHTVPGMGRSLVNHDVRSRSFPVSEVIEKPKLRERAWRRGRAYDQGPTPHCVAYTGKGILNSAPLSRGVAYRTRRNYSTVDFYKGAQANDEWTGSNYDGTSGLGLCRYLKSRGLIQEYRWCFSLEEVLLAVSNVGPVGLGIWWYERMMRPDSDGFIHVGGSRVGGHEVEIQAIYPDERCVDITNSWGMGWGLKGEARMSFPTLETLLHEQGDAFVITR